MDVAAQRRQRRLLRQPRRQAALGEGKTSTAVARLAVVNFSTGMTLSAMGPKANRHGVGTERQYWHLDLKDRQISNPARLLRIASVARATTRDNKARTPWTQLIAYESYKKASE